MSMGPSKQRPVHPGCAGQGWGRLDVGVYMGGLAWLDDGAWILEATEVCVLPCCQLYVNGLDGDCGLDV